jgi:hypothetical protein
VSQLHISKVAVGCSGLEALRRRQAGRLSGGVVPIVTRFRPKRADELLGGSIYWILQHRLTARQLILGFADSPADRRTIIELTRSWCRCGRTPSGPTRAGAICPRRTRPRIWRKAMWPTCCRRHSRRR